MKIPLTRPYLPNAVTGELKEVLGSGMLTEGAATRRFEEAVSSFLGVRHVLAVCNCTLGLEMALRALGIGPGDEVVVPDFTYPATASAALMAGAKVILADVDPETMLIDYSSLEAAITHRTRAVMPVSLFGNPLDYTFLNSLKEQYGLSIIEDAACALGASFGHHYVGGLADITVFSLHPRKFITTGEGGLVTTNSSKIASWMESFKHFGMDLAAEGHLNRFVMIGSNYKMSNLQAAVGLGQIRDMERLLRQRQSLAASYQRLLKHVHGVRLPKTTHGGTNSWQSFVVFVNNRDKIIEGMREEGVEVQIGTYSLHLQPAFINEPRCRWTGDLAGSRYAFDHGLALPLYADMGLREQEYVVRSLERNIRRYS